MLDTRFKLTRRAVLVGALSSAAGLLLAACEDVAQAHRFLLVELLPVCLEVRLYLLVPHLDLGQEHLAGRQVDAPLGKPKPPRGPQAQGVPGHEGADPWRGRRSGQAARVTFS